MCYANKFSINTALFMRAVVSLECHWFTGKRMLSHSAYRKRKGTKEEKIRKTYFFFFLVFQINFKQSFTCNASQCSLMYTNRDSLDQKGIKSTIRMRAGTKLKANAKIQKYKMIFLELKIRKRGTELIE